MKQIHKDHQEDFFIDMDGVLADFYGKILKLNPKIQTMKVDDPVRESAVEALESQPGFYRDLEPLPGAIEAFKKLCNHYNVYLLSTASWENPSSFTDKRLWVAEHLGDYAYKRLILTHNKGHFMGRALVDDRIKNGVDQFQGEHIHFGTEKFPDWTSVLQHLKIQ
jgi:5'-nucleotidase